MPIPFECPFCHARTMVPEQYAGQSGPCAKCGQTITVPAPFGMTGPPSSVDDSAAVRMLIPIGRSGWAIAAGYAGLLSPLGFVAPIAVILGIVALRDLKKHPEKHGMGRAIFGLVMGSLCTLGILVGLIAAALHK